MIKAVRHPLIDQAFDSGVAYGIRVMMARFGAAFYNFDKPDDTIWTVGQELIDKYRAEGREGKVSDEEFSYDLFVLLIEKYGPPILQPRPEFKPFEGEPANVNAVAVEAPVDPPKKESKPVKKKKPNSH
jgi:hypothetical protein